MNWLPPHGNRHESELGYIVVGTPGKGGVVTYNGWLSAGAGYVPNSQSNSLETSKAACEAHYKRSCSNQAQLKL